MWVFYYIPLNFFYEYLLYNKLNNIFLFQSPIYLLMTFAVSTNYYKLYIITHSLFELKLENYSTNYIQINFQSK